MPAASLNRRTVKGLALSISVQEDFSPDTTESDIRERLGALIEIPLENTNVVTDLIRRADVESHEAKD